MKHRMSRLQRAKQFMPFAALRGFEVLLTAVARPKEVKHKKLSTSNHHTLLSQQYNENYRVQLY
jgi:hypothetical protein